jgi:hypothetical protein
MDSLLHGYVHSLLIDALYVVPSVLRTVCAQTSLAVSVASIHRSLLAVIAIFERPLELRTVDVVSVANTLTRSVPFTYRQSVHSYRNCQLFLAGKCFLGFDWQYCLLNVSTFRLAASTASSGWIGV